MLQFLDIFFLIFHSCLIIFNLLGWIWKSIRLINLITLLLTGSSWFILGLFYGIGYCPLTDWHFQVLEKLGTRNLPDSYVKYLIDRIFGTDVNSVLIDRATMSFFLAALVLSILFNLRDWRRKSQIRQTF